MGTGRPAQARQILEAELKRNPPNPRNIRLAMANVDVRSEKYDSAANEYKKLIEEAPQSVELWLRLGETNRRWKHFDEALKAFDKARQLAPNEVVPWMNLAMTMELLGKSPAETKSVYEQILKISPDNAVALNNMAFILAEAGQDLDQALTYAQKAKQKMPDNADISDTLGWVYIKKNLSDDAIKIFRGLLEKRPDHVTWRYHLAMALFQKGDKLQAKKELEAAMKNKPKPEEARKINTLLSRIG
jgi:tetratricopeptide (TPR) repeat protein